jgi:cytoskeletal protein RodZ
MTTGTFGESLKRERELRSVTLEEISAATRIATRFLKAIEDEEWDQLPGGVFNRGFVRAVARYLGLDEENTVAEYTLAVGDRPSVPVWTGSPPVVTPEQPWLAWIIAAVVVLALLGGGWFASSGASQQTADATVPGNSDTSTPIAQDATSVAPAVATDSASASAPISPANDLMELKIRAGKRTKVTIVADNDMVFDGTMKAGENHFFSAADHFQVTAKDAGVLHIELNGKALAPIGSPGHAGKVTLTRDTLKGAFSGGN